MSFEKDVLGMVEEKGAPRPEITVGTFRIVDWDQETLWIENNEMEEGVQVYKTDFALAISKIWENL